ncbi:Trehalase [Gracilaria domingensis]|nr:Trehalase [Gracilaria domingensis]
MASSDPSAFRLHHAEDTRLLSVDKRDQLFPAAKVFCNPDVLRFVQNSPFRPFDDSKTFVDMELAHPPDVVLKRFYALAQGNVSEQQYAHFLQWAVREPAQKLMRVHTPVDYNDQIPSFLQRNSDRLDPHLVEFVMDIKKRWRVLARSFDTSISMDQHTQVSSLIPLPHPFFIPGGRFQECYYWDTFWIVKGLIACDMLQSAKSAVRNLIHLVKQFGFVPNGNRVYYLNRSQPPVLALAVDQVYQALSDHDEKIQWLVETVPYLDIELDSFERSHAVSRVHPNTSVSSYRLSVYNVVTDYARPESFKEDTETADEMMARAPHLRGDHTVRTEIYRHLAAGAESGWDYSSRWFCNGDNCVSQTQAVNIVPCCLNSILYLVEKKTANLHHQLASHYSQNGVAAASNMSANEQFRIHTDKCLQYEKMAEDRKQSISSVLFDYDKLFGFDYDVSEEQSTAISSVAGMMPIWSGCFDSEWKGGKFALKSFVDAVMNKSGLVDKGGLAATTQVTKEQWDFPNCWPPLIDIAVDVLDRVGKLDPDSGGTEAAEEVARRFVNSAYQGWRKENVFHEKYDCRSETGKRGEGGEYKPQTGFGWTNGTILWLLKKYPHVLEA